MPDSTNQALSDARLLLESFRDSPWRELELAVGSMRLSLSRLTASQLAARRALPPLRRHTAGETTELVLTAPHVATLRRLADVDSELLAGDVYATVELLDKTIDLRSEREMRVVERFGMPGDLIEHSSPLLRVLGRVKG